MNSRSLSPVLSYSEPLAWSLRRKCPSGFQSSSGFCSWQLGKLGTGNSDIPQREVSSLRLESTGWIERPSPGIVRPACSRMRKGTTWVGRFGSIAVSEGTRPWLYRKYAYCKLRLLWCPSGWNRSHLGRCPCCPGRFGSPAVCAASTLWWLCLRGRLILPGGGRSSRSLTRCFRPCLSLQWLCLRGSSSEECGWEHSSLCQILCPSKWATPSFSSRWPSSSFQARLNR